MASQEIQHASFTIDCDFPGGNILLERISGDDIWLRQDLRNNGTDWFYWAFRIKHAAGRRLTFHFTGGDVLGVRGPSISSDGIHWRWLGTQSVERPEGALPAFTHHFGDDENELYIALCPLYTQQHLDRFLQHPNAAQWLQVKQLCRSQSGREVELLQLGNPDADIEFICTARHHACENTASYCLEGVLEAALTDDELGRWLRDNIHFTAVPFMDKDGVEAGDQGKNRRPYDHNRDYGGTAADSIYPEVRALREMMEKPSPALKTRVLIDFHCPWIRDGINETVYFVGQPDELMWQRTGHFSAVLQETRQGPMPYYATDNLPFGVGWNTTLNTNAVGACSCSKWAIGLPSMHLAVTLELPYANANGVEVTPDNYRALGRDIALALRQYLESL